MADIADLLRKAGRSPSPYAGIPIALKDLFDIAGEPTPAGSKLCWPMRPPAKAQRACRRPHADPQGFIPVGRVNMTEFAFSGLGINPHYGTPSSPWDRASRRIPGGSSSGTAVAVADQMAAAGLGHRHRRVLSYPRRLLRHRRLQADRPAGSHHRRAAAGAVTRLGWPVGSERRLLRHDRRDPGRARRRSRMVPASLRGLRLAIPENLVLDGMDNTVAPAFERALSILSARRRAHHVGPLRLSSTTCRRSTPMEGSPRPRPLPGTVTCWPPRAAGYDPRIRVRIARGAPFTRRRLHRPSGQPRPSGRQLRQGHRAL